MTMGIKPDAGYVPPKLPAKPTDGGQKGYVPPKPPVRPPAKPAATKK